RGATGGRGKGPDEERADRFRELGLPLQRDVVGVLLERDVRNRRLQIVLNGDLDSEDVGPRIVVRYDDVDVVEPVLRLDAKAAELRGDVDHGDAAAFATNVAGPRWTGGSACAQHVRRGGQDRRC